MLLRHSCTVPHHFDRAGTATRCVFDTDLFIIDILLKIIRYKFYFHIHIYNIFTMKANAKMNYKLVWIIAPR
jgi:hypothetical protein